MTTRSRWTLAQVSESRAFFQSLVLPSRSRILNHAHITHNTLNSHTDDETEDTGSVYTTETGGTETGNEGDGGGSGRFSARRSHSNDGRRRINGVAQTPTGYRGEGGANGQGPEQGCWVFNCIGLS